MEKNNASLINIKEMKEFELPIIYKGEEKNFKANLQVTGYTHRFIVEVNGHDVTFEPDEERNYRAIVYDGNINSATTVDRELLKAISNVIEEILN